MLRKNTANGVYETTLRTIGFLMTFAVVLASFITYVVTNSNEVNALGEDVQEIKVDYVSREVYASDIGYIKQAVDEIKQDVKELRKEGKRK